MKIVALLSWYEEAPAFLAATVGSLVRYVDHVVAVDGAYALFPEARPRSGTEQARIIQEICSGAGIGCTIHSPKELWWDNEIEKRSFMFRLAEQITTPEDWYLVIDGDVVVTEMPHSPSVLQKALGNAVEDAAIVAAWERDDAHETPEKSKVSQKIDAPNVYNQHVRLMFRALRGLQVTSSHFVYTCPCACAGDGCNRCMLVTEGDAPKSVPGVRYMWGAQGTHPVQPALDLTEYVKLEHRNRFRDIRRRTEAHKYYALRNDMGIEGS